MRRRAVVLVSIVAFGSVVGATEPLRATFTSTAYGYSVQVEVNGVTLPIKVGLSDSVQLFARDHPQKAKTHPQFHHLFCLREGRNTLKITYKQNSGPPSLIPFSFHIMSPAYTESLRLQTSEPLRSS